MTGFKRRGALVALFFAFALTAAACGTSDDTTTTAAPTTTEAGFAGTPIKACLVTDLAGVDDRSFNASAWAGVGAAVESGHATEDSFFLESDAADDWQPNIDQMIAAGCEHIVTVGFALLEPFHVAGVDVKNRVRLCHPSASYHEQTTATVERTTPLRNLKGAPCTPR